MNYASPGRVRDNQRMRTAIGAVVALTLCGYFAATESQTLFSALAMLVTIIAVGTAAADDRIAVWLTCMCATVCAFPVISLDEKVQAGLMGTLLVLGALLALLRADDLLLRSTLILPWLIFYASLAAGTIVYTPAGDSGALQVFCLFAITALPTIFFASNTTRSDWSVLVASLFTIAATQVAITFYQVYFTKDMVWVVLFEGRQARPDAFQNTLIDGLIRGSGTFGHPLPQALVYVAAFSLAMSLGRLIDTRLRWFIYVVCVYGVLLGSARSGLLAIVVVAIVVTVIRARGIGLLAIPALLVAGWAADIRFGLPTLFGATNFVESGSYTHRVGVLSALPDILNRPSGELIVGDGIRGQSIILNYLTDQVSAVDNQYISALISAGLIGIAALLLAFIVAWLRAPVLRPVLVGMFVMFFSFDVLSWQSTLSVTAIVVGVAYAHTSRTAPPSDSTPRGRLLDEAIV